MADMLKSVYDADNNSRLDVTAGGTNVATAADARTALGIQQQDSDLDGYAANSSNGVIARTGSGTFSARTITAGSANISISNGDGVSGNPTISAAATVVTTDTTQTVTGLPTFSTAPKTDVITENTSTAGVTIDSQILLKDSFVQSTVVAAPSAPSTNTLALSGLNQPVDRDIVVTTNETGLKEIVGLTGADMFFNSMCRQSGVVTFRSGATTIKDDYGLAKATISAANFGGTRNVLFSNTYGVGTECAFSAVGTTSYVEFYASANGRWCQLNNDVAFYAAFTLSSVSALYRLRIGLIASSGAGPTEDILNSASPTTYNGIWMSFCPGDSDTTFELYANNGGTTSTQNTSVTAAASTFYQVVLVSRTSPTYQVEGYVLNETGTILGSATISGSSLVSQTADLFPCISTGPTAAAQTYNFNLYSFGIATNGYGAISSPI